MSFSYWTESYNISLVGWEGVKLCSLAVTGNAAENMCDHWPGKDLDGQPYNKGKHTHNTCHITAMKHVTLISNLPPFTQDTKSDHRLYFS